MLLDDIKFFLPQMFFIRDKLVKLHGLGIYMKFSMQQSVFTMQQTYIHKIHNSSFAFKVNEMRKTLFISLMK